MVQYQPLFLTKGCGKIGLATMAVTVSLGSARQANIRKRQRLGAGLDREVHQRLPVKS
jgi:hypothetical protein